MSKLKNIAILLWIFTICSGVSAQNQSSFVTIKGHVTDYQNNPLDSVSIFFQDEQFETVHEAITDANGYYEANVKRGTYASMGALNMSEYLHNGSKLSEEDQRLEFWGWNFIADRDTIFNMKYHRMEAYAMNAFTIQGAAPGYMIYCRPMSLTRYFASMKNSDIKHISPNSEALSVRVTINDEEVRVLNKQEVSEYFNEGEDSLAYLFFTSLPRKKTSLPYDIIRVELTDLENGDRGEGVYFYKKNIYVKN